ncbi:MAG TPA: DUF418 domain-containing protein [Phycisphaerales bacterium]|nr:DUF418 domain-containing protein [Phycisphaerales bacterium]
MASESRPGEPASELIPGAPAPPAPADLAPIEESRRSLTMDALRGFAVLGILAMNIPGFAFPSLDFLDPREGGITGWDGVVYLFNRLVFDLKMQSIFSMLFGAGLVVLTGRAAAAMRSPLPIFLRRVAVLAIFGLLHGYFLWYGDILWTYAVCGLLIYPLRKLRARWLLLIGVSLFVFGAVVLTGMGAGLWYIRDQADRAEALVQAGGTPTAQQQEFVKAWHEARADFQPSEEKRRFEAEVHHGSYTDIVRYRAPSALAFQIGFPFWSFSLFRFTGYMLIGIALMRLGVFRGGLSSRAYALMAAVGYLIGMPVVYCGFEQARAHDFDIVFTFLTGWQWNYIGSAFVAFGHIGALMLLFRSRVGTPITRALAAAGRLALTNYLTQSLLCNVIFFGWGFDLWNRCSRTEVELIAGGIWALQIAWSIAWLRFFRHGPFEWLWRSLTYGASPPMRRDRSH